MTSAAWVSVKCLRLVMKKKSSPPSHNLKRSVRSKLNGIGLRCEALIIYRGGASNFSQRLSLVKKSDRAKHRVLKKSGIVRRHLLGYQEADTFRLPSLVQLDNVWMILKQSKM